MKLLSVLAFAMSLILFPSIALAKGASSGGRASVSSSRSFSSPTKSYSSTKTSSSNRTTKSSSWFSSKDDDIECSDLKRSKHAADRIVYKRYCY